MLSRPVDIYGLRVIGDEIIRYVGRTSVGCKTRLRQHKADAKKRRLPVHRWILKHDFQIEIIVLETVPVGGDWALAEQEWIAGYRTEGKLLNISDGGEGPNGYKPTGEHLRKIRDAGKARRTRSIRICKVCDKQFEAVPCLIERGFAKYCSRKCKDSDHGNVVSVKHPFSKKAIEAARQARLAITHCPKGHPYEGENLVRRSGRRICRTCSNEATRVYQATKRGSDPYNTRPQRAPWTVEEIREEALKYRARGEFSDESPGAYAAAIRLGVLDEVCTHMRLLRWTKTDEEITAEAEKYKSISEFAKGSPSFHSAARRSGRFYELCPNLKPSRIKWSPEMIKDAARNYPSSVSFRQGHPAAYQAAYKAGMIHELFPLTRRSKTEKSTS